MPRVIGARARVVDHGGFTVDEYAGNVATKCDQLSIAVCTAAEPCAEPWLTLHYDEWICILEGRMLLHHAGGVLEAKAGETVLVEKGERFRPEFPNAGTRYVPVCLPAFRPDRCVREDNGDSEPVAKRLRQLHGPSCSDAPTAAALNKNELNAEVLFHMCQKDLWEAAKKEGAAYFPPTFEQDGHFTHATCVAPRLITIANHFYQDRAGEWVCLRLSRAALRRAGIMTKDEPAMPVGNTATGSDWGGWVCPHVYGGIPPGVVTAELPIVRRGSEFLRIEGL